ncbi:MAG: hypothetical protein MR938_03345 [Tenericutes bacterium]|nr:hypothetical protein [Mycoplasmatota bacterium]
MYKKIVTIMCVLLLTACTNQTYYLNNLTYEDIINISINETEKTTNINNKGYKYYLPTGFIVSKDNGYNQELLSDDNTKYYLNVDIVSYYYKNKMQSTHNIKDYKYYEFEYKDKTGYLKITENNDNFFVELCYNYAIIEVEVKGSNLRYAISRGIIILNSIQYNDLVIEKNIGNNDIDNAETVYKIPEPKDKDSSKNILEYMEEE